MRRPKDRDFVETTDGLFFCLVGYLHPPDRYMAYLKYVPSDSGRWARGRVFYRRELPYYHVRHVRRTIEFLEQHHPRYVWLDPTSQLRFSFVPKDAVATYYVPEQRLAAILRSPADRLEEEVRDLVGLLTEATGRSPAVFGITGSVLLGLHNPTFSDIDLLVYGAENARSVRRAFQALQGRAIQPLTRERRAQWRAQTAARFGLAADEVAALEARRWNYVLFGSRYVSVHATRSDAEITETYGERRFRGLGPATIEVTVTDATESIFLPAIYRVADATVLDGVPHAISEVVSFEGLYGAIADPGDRIRASGQLEEREDGDGRLVVGAAALPEGGVIRVLSRGG